MNFWGSTNSCQSPFFSIPWTPISFHSQAFVHAFKQHVENKKVNLNFKKNPKGMKQSKDIQTANRQDGRDVRDEEGKAVGGVGD